jgi:uncharacterized protein (DUF433 family)
MPASSTIYGDVDPRDLPVYSVGEAAHHLHLPPGTVAAWALGKKYQTLLGVQRSKPLVEIADSRRNLLSFRNLTELHVLSAIRRNHGVKMKVVRSAVRFLRLQFNSRQPLIEQEMLTDGKDLFIHYYGSLVNISMNGQRAMREMLEQFLKRIEWDENKLPVRLYPLVGQKVDDARPVLIDPRIRFGQPCLAGTRITTSVIAERHKAGDSVEELAEDYGRSPAEISAGLRYERVAAA